MFFLRSESLQVPNEVMNKLLRLLERNTTVNCQHNDRFSFIRWDCLYLSALTLYHFNMTHLLNLQRSCEMRQHMNMLHRYLSAIYEVNFQGVITVWFLHLHNSGKVIVGRDSGLFTEEEQLMGQFSLYADLHISGGFFGWKFEELRRRKKALTLSRSWKGCSYHPQWLWLQWFSS